MHSYFAPIQSLSVSRLLVRRFWSPIVLSLHCAAKRLSLTGEVRLLGILCFLVFLLLGFERLDLVAKEQLVWGQTERHRAIIPSQGHNGRLASRGASNRCGWLRRRRLALLPPYPLAVAEEVGCGGRG